MNVEMSELPETTVVQASDTDALSQSALVRAKPWKIGWVVLLIGLSATGMFWRYAQQEAQQQRSVLLELKIDQITRRLAEEIAQHELMLKGFRGLFNSSSYVSRTDFRRYFESLGLSAHTEARTAFTAIAFHELVPRKELDAHLSAVRKEGFSDYRIFPERETELYAPLVYIEPFDRANRKVVGFDPLGIDIERHAIERARDTGEMSISRKLVLAQDDGSKEPGFVMYVPIYRYGFSSGHLEQRRINFIGWVDAPFRLSDLFKRSFPSGVGSLIVRIFDGSEATETSLFYQSADFPDGTPSAGYGGIYVRSLPLGGHQWMINFHPLPDFGLEETGGRSRIVIIIGSLLSLLLATIVFFSLDWYRQRAAQALHATKAMEAEKRREERLHADRELAKSELRFRSLMENVATVAVQGYKLDGTVTFWNQASEQLYGYSKEEAVGSNLYSLIIPEDMKSEVEQAIQTMNATGQPIPSGELLLKNKHGGLVAVFSSHALVSSATSGEPELFCLDVDLTERKRAETQLKKVSLAVEQSPSSIVITDIDGTIEYVNEAFLTHSGYQMHEVLGKNPRILQSGKTAPHVFVDMWRALSSGQVWKGEMVNRRKDGKCYTEYAVIAPLRQQDGRITNYVAVKENITESKEDKEVINTLAYYDVLTGLPNRRLLIERLQHAVVVFARNHREGSLILIDLDNFNRVNDVYGHEWGDQLLIQVAQRLKSCVRESDTIARLGGDEFVVLIENLSDQIHEAASQAKVVCETIINGISAPYSINGVDLTSTASIGITMFSGNAGTDDILRRADLAMYRAKSSGRNTLRFFDPEMQEAVTKRALLEADLREALIKEQFLLHYQAQIKNHEIIGAEVLIRWTHPLRGQVSPSEFIPVAEEGPLILSIGHWVLKFACKQLHDWADRPGFKNLTLSVNVSARQFKQPDFVEEVSALLHRYGVNSGRLKLELTENLLLDNVEDTIAKMAALKLRGVSFALDDFGTGYSSLSYLKRLPLDELKIDQGFVRDMLEDSNDAAIARMIIALGISMGLEVIAEGVESKEQQAYLAEHGCVAYQGYLFSRPVIVGEFEDQVLLGRQGT